ncbi:PaRep2b protein [Pyrobaculum aerophilum]|uniref:PaRep2b protein n=1 Tax=Pyrobaculum aerophilum TaxID=13773 RepID=UPI001D047C31|nr:PaRep2b protein [Pyrobaculum aerophilum]
MLSVLDLKLGNACGNVVTKIHYRLPIHINVATRLSASLIGLKTVEAPSDEEIYKAAIRGPSAVSRMRFTMAEDYVYRNITVERGPLDASGSYRPRCGSEVRVREGRSARGSVSWKGLPSAHYRRI